MTWRSIKDDPPPKDGTPFLAGLHVRHWNTAHDTYRTYFEAHVIRVNEETEQLEYDDDFGWSLDDYTYWQPLPPPPEDKT